MPKNDGFEKNGMVYFYQVFKAYQDIIEMLEIKYLNKKFIEVEQNELNSSILNLIPVNPHYKEYKEDIDYYLNLLLNHDKRMNKIRIFDGNNIWLFKNSKNLLQIVDDLRQTLDIFSYIIEDGNKDLEKMKEYKQMKQIEKKLSVFKSSVIEISKNAIFKRKENS